MKKYDGSDMAVLERFLKEFFDFAALKKVGFYKKEIKHNDYEEQAKRICEFFGLKSVYEYGKDELVCHLSYAETPKNENNFLTIIPSIYE